MLRLTRNQYLLHNTIAGTYMAYDDVDRLTTWLIGKRVNHLMVIVMKGEKCGPKAFRVGVYEDLMDLRKDLLATMNSL